MYIRYICVITAFVHYYRLQWFHATLSWRPGGAGLASERRLPNAYLAISAAQY